MPLLKKEGLSRNIIEGRGSEVYTTHMPLSSIKGNRFKKMVMDATGTKKFFSTGTKRALNKAGASKLMKPGTKVSRAKAKKVMKALKQSGKTKNIANTNRYVEKQYAKEQRRQENIRRQNIADYNRSRQEEEKAAEAKAGKGNTTKSTAGTGGRAPMQHSINLPSEVSSGDIFVGSSYGHTNLKPVASLPQPIQKPQEWIEEEENIIDLPI